MQFQKFKVLLLLFVVNILLTALTYAAEPTTYIINGRIASKNTAKLNDDLKLLEPDSELYNKYTDYPNGFSFCIPKDMSVDVSLAKVCTVFTNDKMQIEVYYDNFTDTISNTNDYTYYSNRFTFLSNSHTVEEDEIIYRDNLKIHFLKWTRPKLVKITKDKNYYVSADIIANNNEVYTILIKSSATIDNARDIINSFALVEKQGTIGYYKHYHRSKTIMSTETKDFYNNFFSENSPLVWGIFEPNAPENLEHLHELENKVNYKFPFVIRYQSLDENLPLRGLYAAYNNKKYVELTLQTTHNKEVNALMATGQSNSSLMYDILSGKYDGYFEKYADDLKAFGHPILFRLNNEMNGDWCWYSAYYTGKDTEIYKAVWRYIYNIFEKKGVNNVLWVWNPHDVSRPDFKWNHFVKYYPGDEYVDIIGLTGYNTGTYFCGEAWREFDSIYPVLYDEYLGLFDKPFIITEFASSSVGGNKTLWITNMFKKIKPLKNIKAAIWWSGVDYDPNDQPGRIYLMDENEDILSVFRENLKSFPQ